MHRLAHEADVVNGDIAFVGADQAHHHVKTGSFARAVRPEQTHHFAAAHAERDVLDHRAFAVAFLQVRGGQLGARMCQWINGRGGVHWPPRASCERGVMMTWVRPLRLTFDSNTSVSWL